MSAGERVHGTARRGDNIVLIGYRGAGKTTVGRLLAERLGRSFVDTDAQIVRTENRTIAEIFSESGEPAFREAESRVVQEITGRGGQVISVGGGAVLDPDSRRRLHECGACVWLTAKPVELHRRFVSDMFSAATRPRLSVYDMLEEIRRALDQREPLYAAIADHTVDTNGRTPDEVAQTMVELLERHST